jgi:NitT/TauT family transport system substrate-binding protein
MLLLAACSSSPSAKATSPPKQITALPITIGYLPNVQAGGVLAIAQKEGLWSRYGLIPKLSSFSSGPTEIEAMKGGEIDVSFIGPGALWSIGSGTDKLIAVDSITTGADILFGPPGSSLSQLKGSTIGTAKGTSGEMLLDLVLRKEHLTPAEVTIDYLPYPEVGPAFVTHRVQFAIPNLAGRLVITKAVPNAAQLATDSTFKREVTFPEGWVASKSYLASHSTEVSRFMQVIVAANNYRFTHLSSLPVLAATFDDSPVAQDRLQAQGTTFYPSVKLADLQKNGSVDTWLTELDKFFVEFKMLANPVPAHQQVSFSAFDKAAG